MMLWGRVRSASGFGKGAGPRATTFAWGVVTKCISILWAKPPKLLVILLSPIPLSSPSTYISSGGWVPVYKFASPQSKLPLISSWFCQGKSKYGAGSLGIWAVKERDGEARPEISFESERSDPSILAPSHLSFWPQCSQGAGMLTTSWASRGPSRLQVRPRRQGCEPAFSWWPRTPCHAQLWVPDLCHMLTNTLSLRQAGNFTLLNAKKGHSTQFPHLCRRI